jgi:hypothetical protein
MSNQYPNSGKLSHNRYKAEGDKKPNWVGEITMDRSVLRQLMDEHSEDDIVIKLSGWDMSGQHGPWMRLSWNNYKPQPAQSGNPYVKPAPKAPPPPADDADDDLPF